MDSTAGFVLTGRSSRMGRDKARRPIESALLVERTAERVRADAVEFSTQHKRFTMHDLPKSLGAAAWPVSDASLLENVNTPLEWGTR